MPADAHDKKASTKGPIIGQVLIFALEHGQYFLVLVVRFSGACSVWCLVVASICVTVIHRFDSGLELPGHTLEGAPVLA